MPIEYEPTTATIRGNRAEIDALRTELRGPGGATSGTVPGDDEVIEAMATSLRSPMLTLLLTNSGPGGHHSHLIDAGINAVAVCWSTAASGLSELVALPFQVMPGAITRLVGFRPGIAPAESAADVPVDAEQVTALASEDSAERLAAWAAVRGQLGDQVDAAEADASWQLVRAHCSWTATDGTATEDLAVFLRAGESFFALVEDEGELTLVPVPSITAWGAMMHVLPGAHEIRDPRDSALR